jgi:hypothetical protein
MNSTKQNLKRLERFLSTTATLEVLVVPGVAALRALGLRLPPNLKLVASPYHAQALLIVGTLPTEFEPTLLDLCQQLPRPHAVMTVQADSIAGVAKPLIESSATTQDQFDIDVRLFRASWPGESLLNTQATTHDHSSMDQMDMSEGSMHDHSHHMKMSSETHGKIDEHSGHDMSAMTGMDHDMSTDNGMMSMLSMTNNIPRSPDGLAMESAEVTFGPFHYGLPIGMQLVCTLDGDTVESINLKSAPLALHYDARVASRTCLLDVLNRLIQFLELCGASEIAHRVRSFYWQVWDYDQTPEKLAMAAIRLHESLKRTWLLKLRLRRLAVVSIDGYERDAWDRLMSCAEEIVEMSAPVLQASKRTQTVEKNALWTQKLKLRIMETALLGLEVGDVLIAIASFDLVDTGSIS